MQYPELISAIANTIVVEETNLEFSLFFPTALRNAELRIYRDAELRSAEKRSINYPLSNGVRALQLPPGEWVTIENVSIIVPAGSVNPETAERVPLVAASPEYLDAVYGSSSQIGQPEFFAQRDDDVLIFGPWPNAIFTTEIKGTSRPATLSLSNIETAMSRDMPDLLFNAVMVIMAGWQENFGAQSDSPQRASSWEQQYQAILPGVRAENARKRREGAGWTTRTPAPAATIPRA